jgi:hypothetical protein
MPNWCFNNVTFYHEDANEIKRLVKAFNDGKFFNEFVPMPPELLEEAPVGDDYQERSAAIKARNEDLYGYPSWYEWAIANWGTKWEPNTEEIEESEVEEGSTNIRLGFDTAWAPPIEWFREMSDMGFVIEAYYNEEGMGFCGKYTTDADDDFYEYGNQNAEWVRQNIPSDINYAFGISDLLEDMENEELEDEFGMDDVEDGDHEVESE